MEKGIYSTSKDEITHTFSHAPYLTCMGLYLGAYAFL